MNWATKWTSISDHVSNGLCRLPTESFDSSHRINCALVFASDTVYGVGYDILFATFWCVLLALLCVLYTEVSWYINKYRIHFISLNRMDSKSRLPISDNECVQFSFHNNEDCCSFFSDKAILIFSSHVNSA